MTFNDLKTSMTFNDLNDLKTSMTLMTLMTSNDLQ